MATKGPGIYYNEIDNTQFSNPKSVSGTTLAVVGYARKGPLDRPVEVTSWNEFVDIFGKPIESQYSGLAVRLFISAGGTVLFKRIADEGFLSPSVYVVKNGRPKKDGWISLEPGDVAQSAIKYPLSIYRFALEVAGNKKMMFVRTPERGRSLTQYSIVEQLDNQKNATPAIFEANLKNKTLQNALYGFKLTYGSSQVCKGNGFYFETSKYDSKSEIKTKMELALERSNATCTIEFCATHDFQSTFTDHDDYSDLVTGSKSFYIVRSINDEEISRNKVSLNFGEGPTSGATIEKAINDELEKMNMSVKVVYVPGEGGSPNFDKLVFIDMATEINSSIDVSSMHQDLQFDDLFAKQTGEGSEEISGSFAPSLTTESHLFVHKYNSVKSLENDKLSSLELLFDASTDSISIRTTDVGPTAILNIADAEPSLSLLKGPNAIFSNYFNFKGQAALAFTIEKDLDLDKIIIKGSERPKMTKISDDEFFNDSKNYESFYDFLDLKESDGGGDPTAEVSDSSRDMIALYSKEKGSGTIGKIGVEVKSVYNPLNEEEAPKRTLTVYYKNNNNTFNAKEVYEDISLDWENKENRIDIKLNKDVENGGSNYIEMHILKKTGGDIEIPDGFWIIGEKNKDGDKKKDDFISINEYSTYNYSEGNDGIPDSIGSYLFEEAMDPLNSQLANKDLYDFHILLAPDGHEYQEVQDACTKLCETRGDAITIVDPPVGLSKKAVIDWHNGKGGYGRDIPLDSNYVATYWPWCKIYDTSSGKGKFTWVMPSIIMAAQYVMVDKSSGPQAAPAGEVNGNLPVIDIEDYPSPHDRDELYTDFNRINPITKFKDGTVVAYGEKTTQRKNSVLTKIHTRRMLVQIKKQCKEALKGYIFMPTTSEYLGKIANNITAILESYKSKGGLNFYKVICDETNNPIETRQQDIINVDAVLVPQGTIEQININLTLDKNAESVSD